MHDLASSAMLAAAALVCPPLQNRALDLDGEGDHCTVAGSAGLQPAAAITLECWVHQDVPGPGRILTKGDGIRGITDRSYDLSIIDQSLFRAWLFFQDGRAAILEGPSGGRGWRHVALTFSSAEGAMRLFVDGQEVASRTHTAPEDGNEPLQGKTIRQSSHTVYVGRQVGADVWDFDGRIDRLRIWSSARSLGELRCTIDREIGEEEAANHPDLLASWNWEGIGADDAGGHDASLHGGAAFAEAEDLPVLGSDCNGNGVPDACDLLAGTSMDADGDGVPDECECAAVRYCSSTPNSSGERAEIDALGTSSHVANNLILVAHGCPPRVPGIFFYGALPAETVFGNGYLCVGGGLFRLSPPAWTDAGGAVLHHLDLESPPANGGPGAITPSSTWRFQFWFRDPLAGGAFFDLSDGLAVSFCR